MESFEPICTTDYCRECFHLSNCTKDIPDNPLKEQLPNYCPDCGFLMGVLALDGSAVMCLDCGLKLQEASA